jgi:hypothetical protein
MFIARLPLQLIVRASVAGSKLRFRPHPVYLLVRHAIIDGRSDVRPKLKLMEPESLSPWSVEQGATLGPEEAVLKLKFDGSTMNDIVDLNPDHPLHLAFIDQSVIELEFIMSFSEQGLAPCGSDPVRSAGLFLKLGILPG